MKNALISNTSNFSSQLVLICCLISKFPPVPLSRYFKLKEKKDKKDRRTVNFMEHWNFKYAKI